MFNQIAGIYQLIYLSQQAFSSWQHVASQFDASHVQFPSVQVQSTHVHSVPQQQPAFDN